LLKNHFLWIAGQFIVTLAAFEDVVSVEER